MKARLMSLFGGSAALVISGVVVVSISSAPASALTCYTPFSQASTGTPGPVCADIHLSGFSGGDVLSPSTDPVPAWGDTVSISGGGGGSGISGLVTVSGSIGEGHIKATSHIDTSPPPLGGAQVSARGFFGFVDKLTVGPGDVQVNFLSSLSGGFGGAGSGQAVLRVQDLANFALAVNDLTTLVNETFPSQTRNALVTLSANHQYSLSWGMTAFADANVDNGFPHPDVTADLSGTGHLYADIVTPGGILTFASGHNYSSTAAVTPLPPTSIMLLTGLGGLGFLAFRRKRGALGAAA